MLVLDSLSSPASLTRARASTEGGGAAPASNLFDRRRGIMCRVGGKEKVRGRWSETRSPCDGAYQRRARGRRWCVTSKKIASHEQQRIRGRGSQTCAAHEKQIARILKSRTNTYVAGLLLSREGRPPPEVDIAPAPSTLPIRWHRGFVVVCLSRFK